MNIKTLIANVIAAQGRVSDRVDALAAGIAATFEPATVAEVARAVYGEEFAVSRKPETDAERLDKSRYEAIRYAVSRLIADGRWPDNRKPRKPRTPKPGSKSGSKSGSKADAAAATVAIKAGDVAGMVAALRGSGWTRRHLDALAQAIMAAE